MSAGKLAAQVSHASMAFLTSGMREREKVNRHYENGEWVGYTFVYEMDRATYDEWICGIFTKVVCEAKNRTQLLKVVELANALGLKENIDYFIIKDRCLTELQPEEIDEQGIGRTITCIGFRPLPDNIAKQLSKKYQLLK